MVDVRFDYHAIGPNPLTLLDAELLCLLDQQPGYRFPGFRLHALDVLLQRRLRRGLLLEADATERSIRARVSQAKGQPLVARARVLLEHPSPQHLLGGHAIPSLGGVDSALSTPTQILMHQGDRFWKLVQQVPHRRELGRVYMANGGWRQRELIE
jgi:hypothetical protein